MAPTAQPQPKNREAAASAQAVKRGPQVKLEEVPDNEDDTSFRRAQVTNQKPSVASEMTQLTVAEPPSPGAKTEKVPFEWLKPFRAEWTL